MLTVPLPEHMILFVDITDCVVGDDLPAGPDSRASS